MSANRQIKIQPFQVEELKLSAGFLRGYPPSNENVPNTVPVRDENSFTHLSTLIVDDHISGNLEGTFEGESYNSKFVNGEFQGTFTGNFDGNIDAGNISTDTIITDALEVKQSAEIKKLHSNDIEGSFFGAVEATRIDSNNINGTFIGESHGTHYGNVVCREGELIQGNTYGTHTGPVNGNLVGDIEGKFTGESWGTHHGSVICEEGQNVQGNLDGTARDAHKLTRHVNISLSGALSGESLFDGSENIDIHTTINANDVTFNKVYANDGIVIKDAARILNISDGEATDFAYILKELDHETNTTKTYLDLTENVTKNGNEIYSENGKTIKVADGGTGTTNIEGIIKGNGVAPFSQAIPGTDYVTNDSSNNFTHKTIDLANSTNNIKNLTLSNFDPSTISKVFYGTATDLKIPTEKAVKELVESTYTGLSWKNSVICATTENVDFLTGFSSGKAIDGVTLLEGNRILIKDQNNKAENGIYIVNSTGTPTRANDADVNTEINGSAVYVTDGTINGDTGWVCTSSVNDLETDPITFVQFSGTNLYLPGKGIDISANVVKVDDNVVTLNDEQELRNKTIHGEFHGDLYGNATGCTGNAETATNAETAKNVSGGGTVSATTGTFSGKVAWSGGDSEKANTAYSERHEWDGSSTVLNPETGRNSLGLGTLSIQDADNVDITGGKIEGISPLKTEFGGTGSNMKFLTGVVKANGENSGFSVATPGEDYVTRDSTDTLINKSIDGDNNTIRNISIESFKEGLIDKSTYMENDSDEVLVTQHAVKSYVDTHLSGAVWKTPVRVATDSNIDIINDLKIDSIIDGVTLKENDRVLVKDQTLGFENGVYIVTDSNPARSDDFSESVQFTNACLIVLEGNINSGTTWICTTKSPVISSDPIKWSIYGTKVVLVGEGLKFDNSAIIANFDVLASTNKKQTLLEKTLDSDSTKFSNLASEEGTLKFDLDNKGNITIIARTNSDVNYILPTNSGKIYGENSQIIPVKDGGTGLGTIGRNKILIGESSNELGLLEITDSAKTILQQSDITDYLKNSMNLSDVIDYNIENLDDRYSSLFVKIDGSNSFISPVNGIHPIEGSHLATKQYVDSVLQGIRYLTAVKSDVYNNPLNIPNIEIGDTYLIANNSVGDWTGKTNQIATLDNIVGTAQYWSYITPEGGDTVFVKDSKYSLQWNGTDWINIGVPAINTHDALANVKGGEWHLSENQYNELFVSLSPVNSHTHNHNNLSGIQGGSANQKWHLDDVQYKDLTGQTEKSVVHKHEHNDGINIQGGKSGEKYHLTQAEHNDLTGNVSTTLHMHPHSILTNVMGDGHYHLSSTQFNSLTKGNYTNLHKHQHNEGTDIQGGTENERYHLTRDQHLSLTRGEATNIHTHNHEDLEGLLGGNNEGRYHLDSTLYLKLVNDEYGIRDHKDLLNLQGGSEDERYHLPLNKYQEIINFNGTIGDHNSLNNIQGGTSGEFYHLSKNERDYVKNLKESGIDHSNLINVLGGNYHLTEEQYNALTSGSDTSLHEHPGYVKSDGTVSFTNTIEGIYPTSPRHLATKEYVDYLSIGVKWINPVISTSVEDPSTLNPAVGDRYFVPSTAIGEWESKYSNIAIYNGSIWEFIPLENNNAMFDLNTSGSYIWNGTDLLKFSASPIRHNDLADINGGEWHLSKEEHDNLLSLGNSTYHYHASDRDLDNATGILSVVKGGTGLNSIPSGRILYSSDLNTLSTTVISTLGRNLIAANNIDDIKSIMPFGSMAYMDANNVDITGGRISGISPLSVEYGGTGTTGLVGIIKGNGTGAFSTAVANVDYVTPNGKVTFTNKTIDANADGNNIKNINLGNFASGIISTDSNFISPVDSKIPTELAVKTYVDSKTTGEENGVHGFISSTHRFNGAIDKSVLVFTPQDSTPAKYKTFSSDSLINITHLADSIRFSLSEDIVLSNSNQTLSNKVIRNLNVPNGEWANANHDHTSSDKGGTLTENVFTSPISPAKGGTGLASIEKNCMIYAVANDRYGTIKLGRFMIDELTSSTYDEFVSKFENKLTKIKQLKLEVLDNDLSYVPNITSDSDLEINVDGELNVDSDELHIDTGVSNGVIEEKTKDYSLLAGNSANVTTINYGIDFSSYHNIKNKGLYIKDNISNLTQNSTSTLTLGGTFAILPTNVVYSSTNKEIEQATLGTKHSSVILLGSDNTLANDYTDEDLTFILADPSEYIGQYVYIKLITDCQITVKSKENITIDGEDSIVLTQKYQAVTLYSNGIEWLIM